MEYVKVYKENGELDEELTALENIRIKSQMRLLDNLNELSTSLEEVKQVVKEAQEAVEKC